MSAQEEQFREERAEGDLPLGGGGHPDCEAGSGSVCEEDDIILDDDMDTDASSPQTAVKVPAPRRRGRRTVKSEDAGRRVFSPAQRLLILSSWQTSKLPAKDFAPLVGVAMHTLYKWKKLFEEQGPAGLEDQPRKKGTGSKLPEATKRAVLMMKETHPDWGADRIHDMLLRSQGHTASPRAIQRLLEANGYEVVEERTRPHPPKARRFEAAKANDLWQSDLFTFVLKRANRRLHLVAFMDDHSRFIVGFGLHATASGALVREVFERAVANFGAPLRCLTDNGVQYKTWRGKSAFTRLCEKRGIEHIVASPRRPQTLGKVERMWGTLWRECVEQAVFQDVDDARVRIGHFFDWYNFHRTNKALDGLVPADRYFAAAPQVRETLSARVAANALELAQHGVPRKPFYLTGRVGDQSISLHAQGEKVVLTKEDGSREEVDLRATGRRAEAADDPSMPPPVTDSGDAAAADPDDGPESPAPGTSPLDDALVDLESTLDGYEEETA